MLVIRVTMVIKNRELKQEPIQRILLGSIVCLITSTRTRGVNEMRQLASYSDSTQSKLGSSELDSKC